MNIVYESEDELCHYRTKGSKNGVRLYQNKDGSLTPLGRAHYGVGDGRTRMIRSDDELLRERDLQRHLSVTNRNRREAEQEFYRSKTKMDDAQKELQKISDRSPRTNWGASLKTGDAELARHKLIRRHREHMNATEKYITAVKYHNAEFKKYQAYVDEMVDKYGNFVIGDFNPKTVTIGNDAVIREVRLGLMPISDVPFYGKKYSNEYLSQLKKEHSRDS